MKIKKIKLQNNSFFGNQEFTFMDDLGNVYDNIILAGENGSGKTQLLNIIYDFCNFSLVGKENAETREFIIQFSSEEIRYIISNLSESINLVNPTGTFVFIQDFSAQSGAWERLKVMYEQSDQSDNLNYIRIISSRFLNSLNMKFLFRSIFSTVEINYNPKKATAITAMEVDEEVVSSIKSGNDLASEIQQLFIDIKTNDSNDLSIWVEQNFGVAPPESIINSRIKRFKKAFSTIFDDLNFSKIINESNNKKVIFKKSGNEIEISDLSSGEKQIVFRGAFLLQNQHSSKDCCILIDEPEISMHPIWQTKIFNYYRNLFVDEEGCQSSQIFMATHSQYVLKSALDNSLNTLIVLLQNSGSSSVVFSASRPFVLPTITSAEINYNAFNIISNDYHIELYGYLQNKVAVLNNKSDCTVKECDNYILNSKWYDSTKHYKNYVYINSNGKKYEYDTLPSYIRNCIDHPDSSKVFTQEELRISIELLIKICR